MTKLVVGVVLALLSMHLWRDTESTVMKQSDIWQGADFFDNFDFFSSPDPTHGFVDFVTEQQAFELGFVKPSNPIGCDSWSISNASGRRSVRLSSKTSWTAISSTGYLFVIDLLHMPQGCGTWPAWWFVGPNWPSGGEIDVIEGVNNQTSVHTTLHTTPGCSMDKDSSPMTGTWITRNCNVDASGQPNNAGCSVSGSYGSYGAPFNNDQQGGIFALLWNTTDIITWFFPRSQIPSDLSATSPIADPSSWPLPYASFTLGTECPSTMFSSMQMIFDLTFCGDWAGSEFPSQCPGLGDCNSFVQNNPNSFLDAYWLINFVKIMQQA